ncbi:gliding motility-associated C-terminal domain-containing protein [Chitinophaga terrae (ex Kim and Jung 2007)]|uniref:Gliding motility-associated C-terminal domain-containing protein n=1 Tax=Chitinophaga terrae (ex Kim and Jung 2007) TaxID=408074 RepID=A0A1H4DFQ2_9BACT|nr:PKD domain-containing protein [Chitinophaga terrae (ex Kim and Jung 2007)]SEA71102.1 gliding motility-associated C-terminal domain-containing protein [Chitinophaga terrae (ex Kim and Jung 2007)]
MKSLLRYSLYCLILIITALSAQAQSVSISADKLSGCPPFLVNFRANVDPGYQKLEWDFSLGANVTNELAPSKSFQNPGVYHVKFTATYPGATITRQLDIQVYNKPTVKISTNTLSGCAPFLASFTDQSTPGDGSIESITWDFADGSGATGPNASHTFTQAGTYNVISIVTNTMKCSSSGDPVPIKVEDPPTPSFSADKTQSCTAPLTVNFFNSTVNNSPDPVTYTWDYGDGTSGQDFQHTYTKEGRYTVTLTSHTASCSESLVKKDYIVIEKITPGFTFSNQCVGQPVTFTNTTIPTPESVVWTFPDGTTQVTNNASKQFTAAGDYVVTMRAKLGDCEEEITQTVHINPGPVIDPIGSPVNACAAPLTTQFNAQSAGAVSWRWNFGDGSTSTLENPSHTYTRTGRYDISLTATNAQGCSQTVNKPGYINIIQPQATIQTDVMEGCVPLPVNFNASLNSNDPIAGYEWSFGDGTTGTGNPVTHTYTKEGDFVATVKITTVTGCIATATVALQAGNPPVVDFTANPLKSCAKDPIQFTNHSTPVDETTWLWEFPQDGSTSTDMNPNHTFNVIGSHDVILTAIHKGCRRQMPKLNYIQIIPPIADFTTTPDCVNPYHRKFTDNSTFGPIPTPVKTWLWEFGENGATSTDQHPDFTYTTPGDKVVTLTIDNGTCTSTHTVTIHIIDEIPVIAAAKTSVCIGEPVNITLGPLIRGNIQNYTWDWGNNFLESIPANNFDPAMGKTNTYNTPGEYKVTLTITDNNGCKRVSNEVTITVNGPIPDFDLTGKRCKNEPIIFSDRSTTNTGNQITTWQWEFGDSQTQDNTTNADVIHQYANTNNYTVKLTLTDKFGCKAFTTKPVRFEQVKADFTAPGNVACLNKTFSFMDRSSGTVASYAWEFGDNTTGSGVQPTKTYSAPGKYDVTLRITTVFGCTDEITKPAFITVPDPKASFTVPNDLELCPPVKVLFTNTSTGYLTSLWEFGDNGTSTKNNPDEHIYARARTYDVTLTVYAEGGCSSTTTLPLTIKGPDGTMTVTPTQGCVPLDISISATAAKTQNYMWDFDDGTVVVTSTPVSPGHTYTKPGIYYPRVSLEDDQGCVVKAQGNDKIIVDYALADFTVDNTAACGGGLITFTNHSKTLTNDELALPFQNAWDYGMPASPNNTGKTSDGSFTYPQPGNANVKLLVTSAYGCKDEKILPVVIPTQAKAAIAPIDPLCVSGTLQLSGTDENHVTGTQWTWQVGSTTYKQAALPPVTVDKAGNVPVSLTITNADGSCPSVSNSTIVVNPAPNLNLYPADATICKGASLQLQATTDNNVTVAWTDYHISDPASLRPVVDPDLDTEYKVTATNEFGCTTTGQVPVKVSQPFKIFAVDKEICEGESVEMQAGGALTFKWIPGLGLNRSDIANPIAKPEKNITYKVVGYNDSNCFTDTALARVFVRQAPKIDLGPDQVLPSGTILNLPVKASDDVISTEWTPQTGLSCYNCLTPTATLKDDITYSVKVTNRFGCTATDEVNFRLVCETSNIFIPNTFSPNGDGVNDIFYVRGQGMQTVRTFRIFNRWGQTVYERANISTNDISKGWDGKFKGVPLNPDVFVYYAEIVCDKGGVTLVKGNVTLIR